MSGLEKTGSFGNVSAYQQTMSGGKRETNIEIFRIVVMLLIVAHHYVVNSELYNVIQDTPLCWQSIFLLLFGAWGKTGINCFVLISGYFMCRSQLTIRKYVKLLFEIIFYRFAIYFCFVAFGYEVLSITINMDLEPGSQPGFIPSLA